MGCNFWVSEPAPTTWLKGKENKAVSECEHTWELAGMAMPHFVLWCSTCGSIMKTNRKESEKIIRWKTIWDVKCKHNPKKPRVLLENTEVTKLLACAALKQGDIMLSDKEMEDEITLTVTKTKKLKLTVVKGVKVEQAPATPVADS